MAAMILQSEAANQHLVNDIGQCVEQAHQLALRIQKRRSRDLSLCRAFTSLAGDEAIGALAYAIWRGRSRLLSTVYMAAADEVDEADASGVSHAPSR